MHVLHGSGSYSSILYCCSCLQCIIVLELLLGACVIVVRASTGERSENALCSAGLVNRVDTTRPEDYFRQV